MKKMILGTGLLLSGVVGFTGWCIAATQTVEAGSKSSILGCLNGKDWIVLFVFAAMTIVGLVIAIRAMKEEK